MSSELSCCLDVEEPSFAAVTESVTTLMGFLRDHGVSDAKFLADFEVAMAEAFNNAVEHGNTAGGEKFFRARLYLRPTFVELRVADPSSFTGWQVPPELPTDPYAEGGRGHFLMAKLTDEILHEEEAGRHVLVLRKKFLSGPWAYVPGQADQAMSEMTDELVSSYEMISTLLGMSEWLATSPEIDEFSEGALARLCEVTGASFAYARFESGGSLVALKQSGEPLREPARSVPVAGEGVEADVFRTGQEITLPRGFTLRPGDPLDSVMDAGFVTPVLFKDKRRGLLVMGKNAPAPFFNAGELKIARMISEYLGIVVMMAELQERRLAEERALQDLKIAAEIQLSLMPHDFAAMEALDFYGTCRAARQAGGDYFDLLQLPDGSILCLIADVMGKGLPAALLATMLRTNLRVIADSGETDPGAIVTRINRLMTPDLLQLEMFITIACVWISPGRDLIRYANAGHNAPLLQSAESPADIAELPGGGPPAGIFPDTSYSTAEVAFAPGARLLLVTDGLAEATAADGRLFETDRVKDALRRTARLGSRESLDILLDEVAKFTSGADPSDDQTAIILKRTT